MQLISIQEVLTCLSATEVSGQTHLIKFVRATGKLKGSVKTVAKCRKGLPKGVKDRKSRIKANPNRKRPLHVQKGTFPLVNAETGDYFTPLISHIIQFDQYKVKH